jgi:hypothetical protein
MPHLELASLPASHERETASSPEQWLGAKVASLAAVLAYAAFWQSGKPTREVIDRGSELIAELVPWMLCFPDFHAVARREGKAELCRAFATRLLTIDEDGVEQIIETALAMISKIVRKASN